MNNQNLKSVLGIVKNPIGIISLFLVFVEAIAALVIVQSTLPYSLNLILVLFIVFFPLIVLLVFYLLVTKHHKKLYSPADYKDEKNFVGTYNSATQTEELIEVTSQENIENRHVGYGLTREDIDIIKELLNVIVAKQNASVEINEKDIDGMYVNDKLDSDIVEDDIEYKTSVSYLYGCHEFVKQLKNKGYKADIYFGADKNKTMLKKNSEHEAIWLGKNVPLDLAVDVIRMAKIKFPHLKYINMSSEDAPGYVQYQVYIGGATSTALSKKLKKLVNDDFEKLYKCKNEEELHEYINDLNLN